MKLKPNVQMNIISLFYVHLKTISEIHAYFRGLYTENDIKQVIYMTQNEDQTEFDKVCSEWIIG
jgi:hypothetical protein